MNITIRQPPNRTAVSLEEAKNYLRVDSEEENQLIEQMIQAASEKVESYTGRALITQTRRITYAAQSCGSKSYLLPGSPVQQLVEKPILILKNRQVSIDYQLHLSKPCAEVEVGLIHSKSTLQIDYICGYGDQTESVPAALRQAILLLVAHLYENRLTSAPTTSYTTLLPQFVKAMIEPFRVIHFR